VGAVPPGSLSWGASCRLKDPFESGAEPSLNPTEKIPGLGALKDFVAPQAQADLSRLSDDERGVFALIGRAMPISDVIARSGLSVQRTVELLLALRLKGAISPARSSRSDTPAVGAAFSRPMPSQEADAALAEAVDLELERKKEILDREQRMGDQNHFEMLGILPTASSDEVKSAFYELSKRFHPDRYFGKNLGSFKGRLERIFRRLSEANAVLSDVSRREAYLQANPAMAQAAKPQALDPEAAARAAERRDRMSRHPYLHHARRANEHSANGKAALEKGDFVRAQAELNTLLKLDPRHKEAAELLKEVKRKQELARAQQELAQAQRLEAETNLVAAAAAYRAASSSDPQNPQPAARAALLMMRLGEDLKQAKAFAQRAVDLDPKNAGYRVLLARLLAEGGLKKLAKKEFERVLELDPDNAEAKEQLRKLRWTF